MKRLGRVALMGGLSMAIAVGVFVSPISHHTALAASCYGSSCDDKPIYSDCAANDVLVQNVWGGDMSVALVYSYSCVSNWTSLYGSNSNNMHWSSIYSQSPAYNDNTNECWGAGWCYSLMVDGRYLAMSQGSNVTTGVQIQTDWH